MRKVLIAALKTCPSSKHSTGLETTEKPRQHGGKTTRVIPHVQTGTTNLFTFRTCGITINHNRLRISQAKGFLTVGKTSITTPPHLTIKQETLQIPKERANHKANKPFL
jgi:hypothetical protein